MARRKTRTRRKSQRNNRRTRRKTRRRRRRQKGGNPASWTEVESVAQPEAQHEVKTPKATQEGGKRRRKGKRKMNAFFKQMLAAKKAGKKSFTYTKKGGKSQKYVGRKHARLGMIYKKAK